MQARNRRCGDPGQLFLANTQRTEAAAASDVRELRRRSEATTASGGLVVASARYVTAAGACSQISQSQTRTEATAASEGGRRP